MGSSMRVVCIIPARGGSKRIPGKNMRLLHGKPLLAYTVDAAVQSGVFEAVVVSSDETAILGVGTASGAIADPRPDHLAGDTIRAVEVVDEYLKRPEKRDRWDAVAMCLPTCPFRTVEDVRAAYAVFCEGAKDIPRLVGVTLYDFPPQLALAGVPGTHHAAMREPQAYAYTTRSQDCAPYYYPNGSIYLSTVEAYLQTGTFFVEPLLVYPMPAERSFDIDYEYQFRIAECMIQYTEEKSPCRKP